MSRAEALKAKGFDEAEWTKKYYQHQKHYIIRRLGAIKYLQEGKTRQAVMDKVGCSRQMIGLICTVRGDWKLYAHL